MKEPRYLSVLKKALGTYLNRLHPPPHKHLAVVFMSTGNFASLGRVQDFYLLHFKQNFNKAVNQNQTSENKN